MATDIGFFKKVHQVAAKIPYGRVTSYGALAKYLLKHGRPETDLINLDLKEHLTRQVNKETTEGLLRKLKALDSGRYYLQRNVNRQLAMEIMLMRMTAA